MALQNTGYDYSDQDAQAAFDTGGFNTWQRYTQGANHNTNPGGGLPGGAPQQQAWGPQFAGNTQNISPYGGATWTYGPTGPNAGGPDRSMLPQNQQMGTAMTSLLGNLSSEQDADKVNAYTQSILGLQNLPLQQFYATQMPGTVANIQNMADATRQRMDPNSYQTPWMTQQDAFSVGPSANMGWLEGQAVQNVYQPQGLSYDQPGQVASMANQFKPAAIHTQLKGQQDLSMGSQTPKDVGKSIRDTTFWNQLYAMPQVSSAQDPLMAAINNINAQDPSMLARQGVAGSYGNELNRSITDLAGIDQRFLSNAGPGQIMSEFRDRARGLTTPIDRSRVAGMDQSQFLLNALAQGDSINTGQYGEAITQPDTAQLDAARSGVAGLSPSFDRSVSANLGDLDASGLSELSSVDAPSNNLATLLNRGTAAAGGDAAELTGGLSTQAANELQALAGTAGGLGAAQGIEALTSNIGNTVGDLQGAGAMTYDQARGALTADIDEAFAQQERDLEEMLAIRGMSNSTLGDEARKRLAGEKARAVSSADLEALQIIGGERRANEATAAQILNTGFGQDVANQQLQLQSQGLVGSEGRANLGTQADILSALQGAEAQNKQFGQSQALARSGEKRADLGMAGDLAGQSYGQKLAGAQFQQQQGMAEGSEARANLGAQQDLLNAMFGQNVAAAQFGQGQDVAAGAEARDNLGIQNQMVNDALQRAIATGDSTRANMLAQLQAQMGQMGLNLQGAGQEDARRQAQTDLGLREDALFGSEQRANLGIGADVASQMFDQQMRGSQFEQQQALARGQEGRAQAGQFNTMVNDALQRAIATGDYGQATQLAQLQAQQAQAGQQMQAAGMAQDRRMDRLGGMQQATAQDYQRQQANQAQRAALQRTELDRSVAEAGLQRQDVGIVSDLIDRQFQQNMAEGQFDIQRADQDLRKQLADEGLKDDDIDRASRIAQQQWSNNLAQAQFGSGEQQRIFGDQLNALQTDENIYNQRAQLAQQPLNALLSALGGVNVAPGVLGPMQMPLQTPSGGGWQGALGALAGGALGSFTGGVGTNAANKLFGG